jgi:hypothetical protein
MENQTLLLWIWLSNFIDDWTLVTGSYDDGPEAWEKHQTMSDDKKHSTSIMLVLWSLGWPPLCLLMEM